MISVHFQGKPHNITESNSLPQTIILKKLKLNDSMKTYEEDSILHDLLELVPPKDVLFIIEDWNAKVGSQETPGGTGKFGFGIQNEG